MPTITLVNFNPQTIVIPKSNTVRLLMLRTISDVNGYYIISIREKIINKQQISIRHDIIPTKIPNEYLLDPKGFTFYSDEELYLQEQVDTGLPPIVIEIDYQ